MARDHRLVGGDDRDAVLQRRLRRREGGTVRPADQFDENVDLARAASAAGSSKNATPLRSMPRSRVLSRAETAMTTISRPFGRQNRWPDAATA